MSLRVWLPLNGDLQNKGLDGDIAVTNNGATINNKGKIGKCYQFESTASKYIDISKQAMTTFATEASVCFWLKILTWNTSYATYFQAGPAGVSWTHYIFGLLRNGTNSTCCFTISNGSTASNTAYLTPVFDLNKWYHISLIYKTGHCLIYINGQLYKDYLTSIVPNFSNITRITIGMGNNRTGYQSNCSMNDFRIYDHALSLKQIKEISKGLVLHYKLDDKISHIENAVAYPTFDTSVAWGGWNHWGQSGASGSYGQNTDKKFIYNKNNTYSHWWANAQSATGNYLLHQSPVFDGGYRSFQAIIKQQNSLPIDESICYPAWNARDGGAPSNKWTKVTNIGDGFYLCQVDGIHQDGSNDLIGFYITAGYKVYISQVYLQNNKETCSNVFFTDSYSTIYDSSGYQNNGTIVENIQTINDSPRYAAAVSFDGTSAIKVTNNNWLSQGMEQMTINLWIKPTTSSFAKLFSCTESGGWNTQSGSSGYIRFPIHVYTNQAQTSTAYKYDSKQLKISDIPINEWSMITFVYDGNGTRTYINGKLHHTYSNVSYGIHYNLNARLFLGCEAKTANPSAPYYTGYQSDFRIYTTALSPEDIKELYQTSALIDRNQNLYVREVIE